MASHLALLRGVNVGGNSVIKMAELRRALAAAGFTSVRTYIQSGNVLFDAPGQSEGTLASAMRQTISSAFGVDTGVVVHSARSWRKIIADAPAWWGVGRESKHNLLVVLPPFRPKDVIDQVGQLRPQIERLDAGAGVVYQSVTLSAWGRSRSGRLATLPVYQGLTVRNANTARKLAALLAEASSPASTIEPHDARTVSGRRSVTPLTDPTLRLPNPAVRGLATAGITTLEAARATEDGDLLAIHGVGPKAVQIIRQASNDRRS